jgi:hypothetical protein
VGAPGWRTRRLPGPAKFPRAVVPGSPRGHLIFFLSRRRATARDGPARPLARPPARPGFPRELASLAMAHCRLRVGRKQANFLHRIGRGGRRWRLRTMPAWCGSSDESSAWELRWPKFPHRTGPHLCETV